MGEVIGYARVSSSGQSLDLQSDKLKAAGCQTILQEKRSGRQADNRPELQACLAYVREGDTLIITRIDRAARSVLDLAKISDLLQRKRVALRVLDQGLDTRTSEGRLVFSMLSAIAEFESDIRAERTAEGRAHAIGRGVKLGRKSVLTEDQVGQMRRLYTESDFSISQLQHKFGIGRSTVYRALGECVSANIPSPQGAERT